MKKEVPADFMWHLDEVMIPYPVAIITSLDISERINAAPFGLILPYCSVAKNPQLLVCMAAMWHTSKNILATKEFVVNYAPFSLLEQVSETGKMFAEGVNELERTGLTALPAIKVKPPRIKECFQHIECVLDRIDRPTENQTNFIGNVVSISMNKELCGKSRDEKLRLADPLMLYGENVVTQKARYFRAGETRAHAPKDIHDTD